jgi:hypothetical protein
VCRFYEINKNTHHVGMIDSQIAQLSHDSDYFWGNDVVFGDKVRDSNGQE